MTRTYRCKNPKCILFNKNFDIWTKSYSAPFEEICPECKGANLKKMTLGPAVKDGSFNLTAGFNR